jgi:monovalent cation:proton antiporter-2 (CPA2) family protein
MGPESLDAGTPQGFLFAALVLLAAAVVGVWLAKRLGLGSVIGYLAGGLAVGPWGLGVFTDVEQILHFAELGVVLLLFVIGLELHPSRLWSLRRAVFGLGALQVGLTGAILSGGALLLGLDPTPAIVVGLTLALSSTALAVQEMAESNRLATRWGRTAFSVLLFQDLAVIPLLAAMPVLAAGNQALDAARAWEAAKVIGILIAVTVVARVVLRYGLRLVADIRVREAFAAAALLTVVGMALMMEWVGLSMALGAFLAGVLLGDSDYRHALEADIDPFKGLLLGLFFLAVGMSVNVGLLQERPLAVALGVVGLVAAKAGVLYPLARWHGLRPPGARRVAVTIGQGGEFAFVLLTAAVGQALLPRATAELLTLIVIASMLATPVLGLLLDRFDHRPAPSPEGRAAPALEPQVIIAGFGRFGQIVGRVLRAKKIGFTALEVDPAQVDFVRRYGTEVFYGDAARVDLLRTAGAEQADALVVALDDPDAAVRTVAAAKRSFPQLKVYARARNRRNAHQLIQAGADRVIRETFLSSIETTRQLLIGLGLSERESRRLTETFRQHDEARLRADSAQAGDADRPVSSAQESAEELEELFRRDSEEDVLEQRSKGG